MFLTTGCRKSLKGRSSFPSSNAASYREVSRAMLHFACISWVLSLSSTHSLSTGTWHLGHPRWPRQNLRGLIQSVDRKEIAVNDRIQTTHPTRSMPRVKHATMDHDYGPLGGNPLCPSDMILLISISKILIPRTTEAWYMFLDWLGLQDGRHVTSYISQA